MARLQVRGEDGTIQEREVISRNVAVIPSEGSEFAPAVAQRVEYDHEGQTSSITTECGETENRREADEKPDLTIEGVITEDQLDPIKQLKRGDEITLVSDVHKGEVFVRRTTIEQSQDLISYVDEDGTERLAFSFQLQLRQPE